MNIIDFQDERANTYTQAYVLRTMQELQSCLPKGEPPQAPSVWAPMKTLDWRGFAGIMGGLGLLSKKMVKYADPRKLRTRTAIINVVSMLLSTQFYFAQAHEDRLQRIGSGSQAQKRLWERSWFLSGKNAATEEWMVLRQRDPEFFRRLCEEQNVLERQYLNRPGTGFLTRCFDLYRFRYLTSPEVRATMAYNLLASQERQRGPRLSVEDHVRMTIYLDVLSREGSKTSLENKLYIGFGLVHVGGFVSFFARRTSVLVLAGATVALSIAQYLELYALKYFMLTEPFLFRDVNKVDDAFGALLKTKYEYCGE